MNAMETREQATDIARAMKHGVAAAGDAAGKAAEVVANQTPEVIRAFRAGIDDLAERLPDAAATARAGALATGDSLRSMPEPSLRMLAALSVGLGIGLYAAGAPRAVTLVAITPAVLATLVMSLDQPARSHSRH